MYVARKFATLPPTMSTNPRPPKKFAMNAPVENPRIVGHPNNIASGNKASATLTWKT
jgi:hypothetical protein